MERTIIQKGQRSKLYIDKSGDAEAFGVQIFLGDSDNPRAVFDLTTCGHESALRVFKILEKNVIESNAEVRMTDFPPELLAQLAEELD